jgi:sec-independent protein translocase protein TatA
MPFRVGPTELIIILVIVMLIFGVGRLPEIGGALGKSIRSFKKSVTTDEEEVTDVLKAVKDAVEETPDSKS